jgi:2-polyprenyl-3-methyl-5-hydroxy-6-metoxy-1,4-benzoquinol methylase/GT2 family glycosyltransferase
MQKEKLYKNQNQKYFTKLRVDHWNRLWQRSDSGHGLSGYYYNRLYEVYNFLIPPGLRVIEIGCGSGDLLSSVKPSFGVGVDFSEVSATRAAKRHPELHILVADAHKLRAIKGTFDVIILSDLVNDLFDVQKALIEIRRMVHRRSRIILNTHSKLWEYPLLISAKLNLTRTRIVPNWLTVKDVENLLHLADFEMIRHWEEVLLPVKIPFITSLVNKFIVRLPVCRAFALTNMIIARPSPGPNNSTASPSVSIIIPARNEAGNIQAIFERIPEFGSKSELIFVEGGSTDSTAEVIKEHIRAHPELNCQFVTQKGKGKGDAVRLGFSVATGDILMILDADLTVKPEDLPRFYDALKEHKGDFANGVRLVYPMENESMQFANLLGNKFFSYAFSWLLGQPLKDSLCGTKALWRDDYLLIAANRGYFGNFDPFGDFDLLFGAAKLGLRIVDIPVRYGARKYGSTNIHRWKHGWLLLKMMAVAAFRIKFI